MSPTLAFTLVLVTAVGCTATETKVQTGQATPPPEAQAGDAGAPAPAVLQKICEHPCAGPYATIAVFRGVATRLRFDGDFQVCSHPPRVWFDAEGREVYAVGEFPVVAGSEEAKALIAEEEAAQAGTTEAESLRCPTP